MSRLRNFLRRPLCDQAVFLRTVLLLWGIRLGLWILPYRPLRDVLSWAARIVARPSPPGADSADRILWAVPSAARFVPRATCLVQSLAGKFLLERLGRPCRLTIGVAKDDQGAFSAHAWLTCEGRVVLGGGGIDRHKPILTEGAG
jgi:hypothetical protein